MKGLRRLLPLLLVASAPAVAERSPAGTYRLVGEQDIASGFQLREDGRFEYFLSGGTLDERAEGRWTSKGGRVALVTLPKPVPPLFRQDTPGRTDSAALTVGVGSTEGRRIAGIDLRIGFHEGEPILAYTQEDGWSLPAEEKRVPRWIELAVPMHGLVSPRFPIDLARGDALAFTLVPNDLGVVDFAGVKVEAVKKALIVHREGVRMRYERERR